MTIPVAARWIHPCLRPLALDRNGPFLELADDRLLTMDKVGAMVSGDDGASWSRLSTAELGQNPAEPASFQLLRTANGALVMVYLDQSDSTFSWDEDAGEPNPDCRLELWAARSLDGGATWVDRQRLLDGYNANFFGFLQMRSGRLVAVTEHLATSPGRWVVCSFSSDDEGAHWRQSNIIDLGGHGHHDGATEPALAELGDGRLLMLIRTSLDRFWQAFSDEGRYWRRLEPTALDASSSPGCLLRLQSGRLCLVWNRLHPEGDTWPKADPGPAAEIPTSWYREELSLAFSDDDAVTWTPPLVIARQRGGQLSYPYLFERRPGEIWIVAGFAFEEWWSAPSPLRLTAREDDLLRASTRAT